MRSREQNRNRILAEYRAALKNSPRFGPQVVFQKTLPARGQQYGSVSPAFPPAIDFALAQLDIRRLFHHQAVAIDLIRHGHDVIVATPTASGKSFIYNLPVLETLLQAPQSSAIYLFPLKALAQDQLKVVGTLIHSLPENCIKFSTAIYDGDTTAYQRKKIRENPPHILITNPDMLHLSLLGYHDRWAALFSGLTHVIIDEVHTYRGIFGSHMAWVLKRLQRICSFYNSSPRFIMASATIGNPAELSRMLLGRQARVVDQATSPQAKRHFIFINPYDSPALMACQLLEAALKRNLRTIVYTQSRKIAELIYVWTKGRLGSLADRLSPYRAGYLAEQRRDIEEKLNNGGLLGVIATSALELGIDIGALDLCILVGYPGTIMTALQRSGRVGRSKAESLTILVAQQDALDQYFMRYPQEFFSRKVEEAIANPDNLPIMKQHLTCAAAERPLSLDDPRLQNDTVKSALQELSAEGALLLSAAGDKYVSNRRYPHRHTNLRSSGQSFTIRMADDNSIVGVIDENRCKQECYPGAIYLHQGRTFFVAKLDMEAGDVLVIKKNVNYFTKALGEKQTTILKTYGSINNPCFRLSFGYLRVTESVTGFQRRRVNNQLLISTEALELEPSVFETEGFWLEVSAAIQQDIESRRLHFMGGIHALEHAMIGIFPLLVLCDRNDVGGIAFPFHEQLPNAGIFIYDGYHGGVGLCRKAFANFQDLLELTERTIDDCPCEIGCPSCIHSPKCGSGNRPMDKAAALRILKNLRPVDKTSDRFTIKEEEKKQQARRPQLNEERRLPPKRYGVFDIETKRSAVEVGGWHRAERMGVSVAVLYDSALDRYCTYLEKDIPNLIHHMQQLDLVVGFNNKRFDNRVLSTYTSFNLGALPTLDILEEISNRLGYRLSLEKLALHTLQAEKNGNGLQALQWYKEGRFDEIIEYCRKDVELTRKLYLYGLQNEYLLFANKAGKVVRLPVEFYRPGFKSRPD